MTNDETTHNQIAALIPAYAVGACDEEELALVEAHLTTCMRCQTELLDYRRLHEQLLGTIAPVAPPVALRARVLAALPPRVAPVRPSAEPARAGRAARPQRRGLFSAPALASVAALLALVLLLGGWNLRLQSQLASERSQAAELGQVLTDLLSRPDLQLAGLEGQGGIQGVSGLAYVAPGASEGILALRGLPPPAQGLVYQVWAVRPDRVVSVGTFRTATDGSAWVLLEAPEPLASFGQLLITTEPPGRSSPSGDVLVGTDL